VQRANAQPKAGVKEKQTKTRQQRRVAIDPQTAALLLAHRDRWERRCQLLGLPFCDDLFVFSPVPDASVPHGPRSLSHRYRRLAIKLGLRSTRLHSLRHYSATELIAAGVDVRTVAGRLGHGSGGATTLKVYAAWVDEADRRAATTMASIMPAPIALASLTSADGAHLNGPEAIAWVRNRLVHPKDVAEPYRLDGLLLEAWQLLMHYCELLLLFDLGYAGSYCVRFPSGQWAHDSRPVPWAKGVCP
jgi:hypothetical protein